MKRRDVLKLGAAIPVIGLIDYDGWTENTNTGLPDGLENRDYGYSDLVEVGSLGPYRKFAWMDWPPGEKLPLVRAMCWVDHREMVDLAIRVGIDDGSGYRYYDVTRDLDLQERWPQAPVEREALMRVIRVLIREHYGYPTAYLS